jgi:hypothetical protein
VFSCNSYVVLAEKLKERNIFYWGVSANGGPTAQDFGGKRPCGVLSMGVAVVGVNPSGGFHSFVVLHEFLNFCAL